MKKKVVALMIGFAMAVSAFTGCSNANSQQIEASTGTNEVTQNSEVQISSEADESADEGIAVDHFAGTELTIAIVAKPDDQSTDFNEKPIFKLMEEETGIHINWIVIDQGVSEEKKGVMLASDEQPDAYIAMIKPSDIINSPGLFYDLSEEGLLEKWAPNLYQEYTVEHPEVLNTLTWSDGKIYSLPIVSYAAASASAWLYSFPSINMEWLEQLDMEVPTNAEELYDVLVAFRDNDMNGNGDTTDEIPFTFQTDSWKADLSMMMQMWGIGGAGSSVLNAGRMMKDGEVVSTYDTENFRNYLEYMHKLYAEDLLDKEGFTQTSEQYAAKQGAETPIVGVSLTYNNSNFKQDEGVYKLFYFQGMEDVEPYFMGGKNKDNLSDFNAFGFVPTAESNIEALLHWWNHMGSTEEMKQIAHGNVEGVHYEVLEDGRIQNLVAPALGEPGYIDVWTNGLHNHRMPFDPDKVIQAEATGFDKEREDFIKAIVESGLCAAEGEGWPYRIAPQEKVEERTFIELELEEYIESFHAEAIMNGVTDTSWQAHLDQLKAIGYYEWLDYWKSYVANSWE